MKYLAMMTTAGCLPMTCDADADADAAIEMEAVSSWGYHRLSRRPGRVFARSSSTKHCLTLSREGARCQLVMRPRCRRRRCRLEDGSFAGSFTSQQLTGLCLLSKHFCMCSGKARTSTCRSPHSFQALAQSAERKASCSDTAPRFPSRRSRTSTISQAPPLRLWFPASHKDAHCEIGHFQGRRTIKMRCCVA